MKSSLKEVIFFLSLFSGVSAMAKVLLSKKQEVEGEVVRFFSKTKGSAYRFAVTICDRLEKLGCFVNEVGRNSHQKIFRNSGSKETMQNILASIFLFSIFEIVFSIREIF